MNGHLSLDGAAFYSIQLLGVLDQNWADQFGSLTAHVIQADDGSRQPVTFVVGEVVDQAALAGFLNLVYSLGMPLLSVNYLGTS